MNPVDGAPARDVREATSDTSYDGPGCQPGENTDVADEIVRASGRPLPQPMSAEQERKVRENLFGIGLSLREQRRRHDHSWLREVRRYPYLRAYRAMGPRRPARVSTRVSRASARPRTSHAARRRVASSRGDPDPGENEPPPPAQRRGEAVADNLRLPLRADSPATAERERAVARARDTADDRSQAPNGPTPRPLRASSASGELLPPADPFEASEVSPAPRSGQVWHHLELGDWGLRISHFDQRGTRLRVESSDGAFGSGLGRLR